MPEKSPPLKLLPPKIDIVFKLLFTRNQDLLKEMLSAILEEEIDSLEVLNPTLLGQEPSEKFVILDIRVLLGDGKRVDVEMQIKATKELASRLVYYTAKDFSTQLKSGERFRAVTPTITVVWLIEPLFPELKQLHSIFELRERATGQLFTDDIRIHLLQLSELGRIQGSSRDKDSSAHAVFEESVRRWARFLTISSFDDLNALAKEDPIMTSAAKALEDLSQDPEAVRLAEQRADSDLFYDLSISNAEARGEARGEVRGREIGEARGEIRGRQDERRHQIEKGCTRFDIELSAERRTLLMREGTDLEAILDSILFEQSWPKV